MRFFRSRLWLFLITVGIHLIGPAALTMYAFVSAQSPETPVIAVAPAKEQHHKNVSKAVADKVAPLNDAERTAFSARTAELLQEKLTLQIAEDIPELISATWSIPLADHPEWIIAKPTKLGMQVTVSPEHIQKYLEENIVPQLPIAEDVRILALPGEGEVRSTTEGERRDGWSMMPGKAADHVAQAVSHGLFTVTIPIQRVQGRIMNETDMNLGVFTLLSRGHSDFSGSVPNRIFNIGKALDEHLNGVLVPPGELFSFNATLGGEVEEENGWEIALGIFNGEELKPTAGGGICQASTTVYRAAVQAGLPIEERRNHSRYIKYYKLYGEGLDATVYDDSQDLTFVNDTPGYLFFHAYQKDDEAFVELYGTPDGRTVVLEGPYREHNAPRSIRFHPDLTWAITERGIAWLQRIIRHDGTEEESLLVSRYMEEIPQTPAEEIRSTTFDPLATSGNQDSDQPEQT